MHDLYGWCEVYSRYGIVCACAAAEQIIAVHRSVDMTSSRVMALGTH
jgi:hypothetical protein